MKHKRLDLIEEKLQINDEITFETTTLQRIHKKLLSQSHSKQPFDLQRIHRQLKGLR